MTHLEKIEAIRKAAIEANPEIVELKFGCRVWVDNSTQNGHYSIWEHIGKVDVLSNANTIWRCVYSTFATVIWGNFELEGKPHVILGRPIRLADVLLAISKKDLDGGIRLDLPRARDEKFGSLIIENGKPFSASWIFWHLVEDDLTLQPEATISFLYDLLK